MEKIVEYKTKEERAKIIADNPGLKVREDLISKGKSYLILTDEPKPKPRWSLPRLLTVLYAKGVISDADLI